MSLIYLISYAVDSKGSEFYYLHLGQSETTTNTTTMTTISNATIIVYSTTAAISNYRISHDCLKNNSIHPTEHS